MARLDYVSALADESGNDSMCNLRAKWSGNGEIQLAKAASMVMAVCVGIIARVK